MAVWTGTPHLRIIDNSTDFDTKLKRLLKEVVAFLGIPKPLEIERKFLIEYPDIEFLNSIKTCRRIPITQAYLTTPEEGYFRIRKRGEGDKAVYIKTVKSKYRILSGSKLKIIFQKNNTTRTLFKGSMLQASSVKTDIALSITTHTTNLMFIRSGMTGQQ